MAPLLYFNASTPSSVKGRTPWIRPTAHFGKSNLIQTSAPFMPVKMQTSRFRKSSNLQVSSALFQDLGLSGLSTACDPRTNQLRKLFWGFLWLAALVCCVNEVTNCIITFASSPFTVDVKYKHNQTITAPYITLCPADADFRNPAVSPFLLEARYCNASYKNALELFENCNLTIENLWNISRFEMKDPLCRLFQTLKWIDGFTQKDTEDIQTEELATIHGICLMFKMSKPLQCTGMENGIEIEGHTFTPNGTVAAAYYTGVIHSEEDIQLIQYTGTIRAGFYAAYRQITTVALRVQQIIHVNTWKNPCQSHADHMNCLLNCIERKIIENSKLTPCRLPYMKKTLPLPLCNSKDEFLDMYSATQASVSEVNAEVCGCIKPCNKLHYKEDYFFPYPVEHLMGLYVIIPQCDIEVIEDQLNYNFTLLLSNIGGNLGLFLGMSILSIIEILEVLFWKVCKFPVRAT